MNLNKFFTLIFTVILTAAIFTGCGDEDKNSDKIVKLGMLQQLNASEQEFNGFIARI